MLRPVPELLDHTRAHALDLLDKLGIRLSLVWCSEAGWKGSRVNHAREATR